MRLQNVFFRFVAFVLLTSLCIFLFSHPKLNMGFKYILVPYIYRFAIPPRSLPRQDCEETLKKVNNVQKHLQNRSQNNATETPRVIHQSWSSEELPHRFALWQKTWQSCFPVYSGWLHVLWTDEDNRCLIQEALPWFLPHFDSLPGTIYRVDVVRYAYLWLFGGIYTDLDTECLRPFEILFTPQMKVIFGAMQVNENDRHPGGLVNGFLPALAEGVVQNSMMVARVKEHSLWVEMFHRIMRREDFYRPEELTGSGALVKVIEHFRQSNPNIAKGIAIFSSRYFNPFSWANNKFSEDCKAMNQMTDVELSRCRAHFVESSFVVQYHSQSWGEGLSV